MPELKRSVNTKTLLCGAMILFITMMVMPAHAQYLPPPSKRVGDFWMQLYKACKAQDIAVIDSLYEAGKNEDSLVSFENHLLLSLYLGKYDDLNEWLPQTNPPKPINPYGYFLYLLDDLARTSKKQERLIEKMKQNLEASMPEGEAKDYSRIYLMTIDREISEHEAYNKHVLAFLKNYPGSRHRIYVGTEFNEESRPTGGNFGIEMVPGLGALHNLNLPGGVKWKNWDPGMMDLRLKGGYKKNIYSIGFTAWDNLDSVPRYVNQDGPYNQFDMIRFYLRYDRQLFSSRRFDGFAYADMGLCWAQLRWSPDNNEEEETLRAIEFGSLSCGLKLNWNFNAPRDVVYVDTPFYSSKSYLSLEIGIVRNYYNFTPNYRALLTASLSVGLMGFGTRKVPNSGLR